MVTNRYNAKFYKISDELQRRIENKTYSFSQKLPSEYDLAKEFGVTRDTIRKAIENLISQHLVIKRKGRGSYVLDPQKIQSGQAGLQSFTEVAKKLRKTSETKFISYLPVTDFPEVYEALALPDSAKLSELVRIRSLDEIPVILEKIYLPSSYLKGLSKKQLEKSLYDTIEKTIEIAYSQQEIEAALIDEELSKIFNLSKGDAVFKVHSTTYSIDSQAIYYEISYYRADKYTFKNTLFRNR